MNLPIRMEIHLGFHVSLLKQCIGDPSLTTLHLPLMSTSQGPISFLETLLQYREVLRGGRKVKLVLIQWHGLSPDDTSWEDVVQLLMQYPELDLKDKVVAHESSIVMLPVKLVNKSIFNQRVYGKHELKSEVGIGSQHVGVFTLGKQKEMRNERRRLKEKATC